MQWGQRNLVMELVNIYYVLSCSFVEIMRLYVVSACIKLRHCWYNLALVRIIVLVAAYCVAHAKPCTRYVMFRYAKAYVLELVL